MPHPINRKGISIGFAVAAWIFGLTWWMAPQTIQAQACSDLVCACGEGETAQSCHSDCGVCGDLTCDPYENHDLCPLDCGPCGDLECEGGETHSNCPGDCPLVCGDLICDLEEIDCAIDCGTAALACETEGESPEPTKPPDDDDVGHGSGCSLMIRN